MKTFKQLNEEKRKSLAVLFGRMQPITKGHEENVNGLKKLAHENNADHLVIASHSHDASKNPMDVATKMKHLKRAFPDTNITHSDKANPTIMHQAAKAHAKGYNHLIVAGGGDRAQEYHHLLNKYNGVPGRHGYYKFDKIEVKSTGERKAGVSGTDMRNHIKSGNFNEFRKGLASNIAKDHTHSAELFHDMSKGMGLHEDAHHGYNKAIFISGGPGSGKDVIIRECIAQQNLMELNFIQAFDLLANKKGLSEKSKDLRMEAIRDRKPLIINGPADDIDRISYIKEELEELGYLTMMIFVDTANDVSKERNAKLTRMMSESIRVEKWQKSQKNVKQFEEMFLHNNLIRFDNSDSLEYKGSDISECFTKTQEFFNYDPISECKYQGRNRFLRLYEAKYLGEAAPVTQMLRKKGKIDDVRDGDVKGNSIVDPASRVYAESPELIKRPIAREPRFNFDKDKINKKKFGDSSLSNAKVGKMDGIGSTYDTRGPSNGGAGLGNQTYSESGVPGPSAGTGQVATAMPGLTAPNGEVGMNQGKSDKKIFKKFRESIDSPSTDSGLGGVLGGASNKEDMVTPGQKYATAGITIKKNKKTGVK